MQNMHFDYIEYLKYKGVDINLIAATSALMNGEEHVKYLVSLASLNKLNCDDPNIKSSLVNYFLDEFNAVKFFAAVDRDVCAHYIHLKPANNTNILLQVMSLVSHPKKLGVEKLSVEGAYVYCKERWYMDEKMMSSVCKASLLLCYPLMKSRTDQEEKQFNEINKNNPIMRLPIEILDKIIGYCFQYPRSREFCSKEIAPTIKDVIINQWQDRIFNNPLSKSLQDRRYRD